MGDIFEEFQAARREISTLNAQLAEKERLLGLWRQTQEGWDEYWQTLPNPVIDALKAAGEIREGE